MSTEIQTHGPLDTNIALWFAKVKAESEANGPLVDHIDSYFMDPTSYSRFNKCAPHSR